jgi:hypothetical protein
MTVFNARQSRTRVSAGDRESIFKLSIDLIGTFVF